VFLIVASGGCQSENRCSTLQQKLDSQRQESKRLRQKVEQLRTENEKLKGRLKVLSNLPSRLEPEQFYNLKCIKLTSYTNFYDKDGDGRKEKLIVYLQPIDAFGDVIKAAGSVDVQLWDLNKPQSQALLGQWHVNPGQLQKLWFAALVKTNYRLAFDVGDKVAEFNKPLTVKVTFTDYSTGKVFQAQRLITPR